MDRARLWTSSFLSLSIICLSAALAYFSYTVIRTLEAAPQLIHQAQDAAKVIDPILSEVTTVTTLIPQIIEEVALVRAQIPPILQQVEAIQRQIPEILTEIEKTRAVIPSILAETEQVRLTIPPILSEVAGVRKQIPSMINESAGYRALIPHILAEVEATREMVPVTLNKTEYLIAEARVAGQEASEGAVTGFFTGIIKAPFKMVSGASSKMMAISKNLNDEDVALLTGTVEDLINQGNIGQSKTWSNKKSGVSGTTTLARQYKKDGKQCRVITLTAAKANKQLENTERTICVDQTGEWKIIES
ncbi:hypothetical protein SIN8267_01032 [Sinobacterium norvegicum]|uniref:Surface antigen domain-containing protein n=1 Tax=Sinobacterium norvegicum TaxID=1641715 RepID=A0ABM9ACK3_9GAMM|nr:RT0821/Lpp0805 family surface protein [Sinobacterium norvegicum]CAH0990931.1 hypothetical protein SIN8267_01032 [Sinobacterium norvegicum]